MLSVLHQKPGFYKYLLTLSLPIVLAKPYINISWLCGHLYGRAAWFQ